MNALPRRAHRAYAVLALTLLGYAASTVLRPRGWQSEWLDDGLTDVVEVTAGLLCLAGGWLQRTHRLGWLLLGSGLLLWAAGDVYWGLAFSKSADPGPSLADVGYLAFYPLAYVGLGVLIRDRATRFPRTLWWDGAIVGLGAAAVGAALAFGTIQQSVAGLSFTTVVNLAYPVGDLVLIALAAAVLTMLRGQLELRWVVLAVGALTFGVADITYLVQTANNTYIEGTLLDVLWPAAALMLSWATWLHPRNTRALRVDGALMVVAPVAAASAATAILVYGDVRHLSVVAVALAGTTLAAAGMRMTAGFRDVQRLAETRRLALTDELTGLGNRRLLVGRLDDLVSSTPSPSRFAVLLIDLDRFKEVNDAFGHPVGDELLMQLGPRLRQAIRSTDVLARLGGDEFAVLLLDSDAAFAATVADRIAEVLSAPFELEHLTVHTGASVGIATFPDHATDTAELLRCADVAMYRAKAAGARVELYDVVADHSLDRFQLVGELRAAIDDGSLSLHYQPQVELPTGRVRSVEALLRWAHPTRGNISPDVLIPLAEESRLMRSLTHMVLEQAITQCAQWLEAGRRVSVAVNLSATNLLDDDLPADVEQLLERLGVPPELLVLEITETTLFVDPDHALAVIGQLRALGVSMSVDDFGTGFSSLSYLRDLPVEELKLDRSFVGRLSADPHGRDAAIAGCAVALGHSLGLRVVAEGVEDARTLDVLTDLGFDAVQGYYFGRPVAAIEVDFSDRLTKPAFAAERATA